MTDSRFYTEKGLQIMIVRGCNLKCPDPKRFGTEVFARMV